MVVVAQVRRIQSDDEPGGHRALSRAVDRASAWTTLMERLWSSAKERDKRRSSPTH
jgi:hypothetical protein